MRTTLAALMALGAVTAYASPTVDAARAPVACAALHADDLAGSGYAPVSPQGTSLRMRADQIGAPSDLHTELCFHYQDTGRRRVVHVTIETFDKIDGLAQWLEDKNRQAAGDGARIAKIGEATCERGDYVQKDGGAERIQHYLTCDQLVGRQRIGIGFEAPDRADGLPSDEATLRALAAVIARLPAQ